MTYIRLHRNSPFLYFHMISVSLARMNDISYVVKFDFIEKFCWLASELYRFYELSHCKGTQLNISCIVIYR